MLAYNVLKWLEVFSFYIIIIIIITTTIYNIQ